MLFYDSKDWVARMSPSKGPRSPAIIYAPLDEEKSLSDSSLPAYSDSSTDIQTQNVAPQPSRRRCSFTTALAICLAAVVFVETVLLLRQYRPGPGRRSPTPDFKLHDKAFVFNPDWEFSPVAHDLWRNVLPHSGLVAIEHPHEYGLKDGLRTELEDAMVYSVTVTHEYHCLRMIRENFYGLATRDPAYMSVLHVANSSVQLPEGRLSHLFHCMDYLRQTILCRADTTLEWRSDVNGQHIDGYGPAHQCRVWSEVHDWMLSRLPPDEVYQHSQVGETA